MATILSATMPSYYYLVLALVAVCALRMLFYEMTTGATRRKMSRDHGCKPPIHRPQKGLGGYLLGLDAIQMAMQAGKEGRFNQESRLVNFVNLNSYTTQFRVLMTEIIITIEPENIKTMLSTNFHDYILGERRARSFIPVFGHGIFDTDGAAWERSRALIRPNFTRQQVADLDTFEVHVNHLINRVPRDGSTVDLQDLFFSLTMDSATEFLFGKSTNTLVPEATTAGADEFVKSFVYVTECMSKDFRSGGLTRWMPNQQLQDGIKTMHAFADSIVQDALRRHRSHDLEKKGTDGRERYVFLHELLKQTQDLYTLRSELLNILLAGRDTTAGLLANTWWVLARRSDIWSKLRAEVDALNGERPTYTQIKEMKYLRFVMNESLRLMPVVPSNNRTAVKDTILPLGGGPDGKSPIFIPKGQVVAYSPWAMHRRTDYYGDDALEFKPERWETLRPGWEYLPFNGGPRICIGQQFALLEASYTTIRLMQKFQRIEPRDSREWTEFLTLTLSSGVGTKVALFEQ